MNKGYTYTVNFHKKVDGLGWVFHSFHTTDDAIKMHVRSLMKQQVAGTVRNLETIKLK